MKEVYGDAFKLIKDFTGLCITTNGAINSKGECVMGRGIALEVRKYYPTINKELGDKIKVYGNIVNIIKITRLNKKLIAFPVKHNWWEKADVELIKKSCIQLMQLLGPDDKVLLPRPGCGNGRLNWGDVKPVISPLLDDRVYIVHWADDTPVIPERLTRVAIIGSRTYTHDDKVVAFLKNNIPADCWVTSGNAEGADQLSKIFAKNIQYLPWSKYNAHLGFGYKSIVAGDAKLWDGIIYDMFPWLKSKSQGLLKLVRRNMAILLGVNGTHKVDAVFYWVPETEVTGGTKYAIDYAKKIGIPCIPINPK